MIAIGSSLKQLHGGAGRLTRFGDRGDSLVVSSIKKRPRLVGGVLGRVGKSEI